MADRSTYLENTEDQISAQKRMEQRDGGLSAALATVAGVAVFVLSRKKIDLSRAFSSEVKSLGRAAEEGLSRYAISEIAGSASTSHISSMIRDFKALIKPLPSGVEQLEIARMRWDRARIYTMRPTGVPYQEWSIPSTPAMEGALDRAARRHGFFQTLFQGPISAIAPNAPIVGGATRITSGEFGGIYARGTFYELGRSGEILNRYTGLRSGIVGTGGSRLEFLRLNRGNIGKWKDQKDFYRRVLAPSKAQVTMEQKRIILERIISDSGASFPEGVTRETITDPEALFRISEKVDELLLSGHRPAISPDARSVSQIFSEQRDAINQSVELAIESLVERNANKAHVGMLYRAHKAGTFLGIGPQFAGYSAGVGGQRGIRFQEAFRMGEEVGFGTGRKYAPRNWRYTDESISISGAWGSGEQGKFYLHTRAGAAKRSAIGLIEGTFFRQMEQTFGVGISAEPNFISEITRMIIGSKPGSWGDFFARRYVGGFGRLAILGMGGFTTYKVIDYLARKATGGWGVTDAAGKLYTSSREFQQKVIDSVGIVDLARKAEHAFPGLINSPLARLARLTAPYWATIFGGKVGGRKGAMVGLSLGIATALLTWGDITQSPEELHRIYTGEQDIPVRKGRWWTLGKTPFGGGKIMYWRPHWYPLMRSKYKYRGQLWESEEDELANRGPLAPILSPILTGKKWDPYAWEKRHYYDRPYPLTGELFEPTMPFSWLLNATIGRLVKPQRIMHPEYWGVRQGETDRPKSYIPGAATALGFPEQEKQAFLAKVDPSSNEWLAGMAGYTITEQMGLRGFLLNTINKQLTGREDFLPEGPVVQTASRATGYERGYWDLNLGDPQGTTEFFRRILPHRRRGIEEYNPIPNEMPDWLPGENYYINFRTGDPYTKIEMGEARLPGAGYESLHRLHSGIPGVYDAVDRYMILSDVAPYSNEYRHYFHLAKMMTKDDKFWNGRVMRKDRQRSELTKEFEFLDLNPPEDITGTMRGLSKAYRKTLATIGPGGVGGVLEPFAGAVLWGQPIPLVESPLSKFLPYRTAEQTYKDFRVMGSDFAQWDKPIEGYVKPYINKIRGMIDPGYIPEDERKRREYEEYFDKLTYIKNKKLQALAESMERDDLARKFKAQASKTMIGVDESLPKPRLMGAIPKRERTFFDEFSSAEGKEREDILRIVSPQMARIYKAQWATRDTGLRARSITAQERADETEKFFQTHYLPDDDWAGYNPDIDIRDVQLKTVSNEGMDIHKFDLWESQQRAMSRRGPIPEISNINEETPSMNIDELKRMLQSHIEKQGYSNTKINLVRTASRSNSANLKIKIKQNKESERKKQYEEALTV